MACQRALGGAGEVGGDDVGVQQRVAGPAGAVVEGGGDDAVGLDPAPVLGAPPGVDGVLLEVVDDGVDGLPVGLADRGSLARGSARAHSTLTLFGGRSVRS